MVSHGVGLIWQEIKCLLRKLVRAFGWAQLWNLLELTYHTIPILFARVAASLGNSKIINRT